MRATCLVGLLCLAWLLPAWTGGPFAAEDKAGPDTQPVLRGRALAEWVRALQDRDLAVRLPALTTLGQLGGPETLPAAPALVEVFRDGKLPFLHPLAALALARIGPLALPELKKALADRDPLVRGGAILALSLMGPRAAPTAPALVEVLRKDGEAMARSTAAAALGQLGPDAREALPALRSALGDRDATVRVEAAEAVWKVGREAAGLDVLVAELKGGPLASRAAQILGAMSTAGRPATAALEGALRNPEAPVRLLAAEALARIRGEGGAVVLAVLTAELRNEDPEIRQLAVRVAGELALEPGPQDLLLGARKDREDRVRREAACGLVAVAEKRKLELVVYREGLQDGDPGVRWWTALAWLGSSQSIRTGEEDLFEALREPWQPVPGEREPPGARILQDVLASAPARALPALARVLARRPAEFRIEAARAHALFGSDARPALPILLATLSSEELFLRQAAAEGLGGLGAEVVPALVKALGATDARTQEGAARALAVVGEPARSARPALLGVVKGRPEETAPAVQVAAALALWEVTRSVDPSLTVLQLILPNVDNPDRWQVVEAIARLAAEARPPIRGLTGVLLQAAKDRDARVRAEAVRGLWQREGQARTILPLLTELLGDRDPVVRETVVETLGEMPAEPAVLTMLVRLLDEGDPRSRTAALAALAHGGEEAVPELIKGLSNRNARVRSGVAKALGRIGPAASAALSPLLESATDPDEGVRAAAGQALLRIRPEKRREVRELIELQRRLGEVKEGERKELEQRRGELLKQVMAGGKGE